MHVVSGVDLEIPEVLDVGRAGSAMAGLGREGSEALASDIIQIGIQIQVQISLLACI